MLRIRGWVLPGGSGPSALRNLGPAAGGPASPRRRPGRHRCPPPPAARGRGAPAARPLARPLLDVSLPSDAVYDDVERLVARVLVWFAARGVTDVTPFAEEREDIFFKLPAQVRPGAAASTPSA